jgi:integrase
MAPASIRRYLSPLSAIFKLALRRGLAPSNPLELLSDDERPSGGGLRDHYIWSPDEILSLLASARALGSRSTARYDYSPLIELLALTGMRVSEALALRVRDVDLPTGELCVTNSLGRRGDLHPPKTKAGVRRIPLSKHLVELLACLIPGGAEPDDFVFHSQRDPRRPLSYWNFRERGFGPTLEHAGLGGKASRSTAFGLRPPHSTSQEGSLTSSSRQYWGTPMPT